MPTTAPVDPANPVDPSTPVTPVDPTKPTEPVVAPVLPSDVVGKCTHTSGFNTDKTVTDMCAAMEEKECFETMFTDFMKDQT